MAGRSMHSGPRPLPQGLREKLRSIARKPQPSAWVLDSRYAAAACYLLTGLLVLVLGGAELPNRFRATTQTLGQQTTALVSHSGAQGKAMVHRVEAGMNQSRHWISEKSSSFHSFLVTTWERIPAPWPMNDPNPQTPHQGGSNGHTDPNRC